LSGEKPDRRGHHVGCAGHDDHAAPHGAQTLPSIVVDFGTATTLDAIGVEGDYLGGSISPGVEISLEALVGKAAALSTVELIEPRSAIGKNTSESIRSGVLFGYAAMIDGLTARFIELTLHGLRLIWQKNND